MSIIPVKVDYFAAAQWIKYALWKNKLEDKKEVDRSLRRIMRILDNGIDKDVRPYVTGN